MPTTIDRRVPSLSRRAALAVLLLTTAILAWAGHAAAQNTLGPDQQLGPDQALRTSDGRFQLTNQSDGVLVLDVEGAVVWSRGPFGGTGVLVMDGNGNLVYYVNGQAVWATHTEGNDGASLVLQDDGNAVLTRADGSPLAQVTFTSGAKPPDYWLGRNGWLGPGVARSELTSANNRFRLRNQPNGELALIVDNVWTAWTTGPGSPGEVWMGDDGNLVMYRGDGTTWDSHTNGHAGAHLQVEDSGDVVIYDPPWAGGAPIWSTGTANAVPPTPTLTINGFGNGEHVTIATKHAIPVQVTGSRGTAADSVQLFRMPGAQFIESKSLAGYTATTVFFDNPPLPDSGTFIAYYFGDDGAGNQTVLAISPVVTVPGVSLTVNGHQTGAVASVRSNESIFVSVLNHLSKPTDAVGIFRVGAPNSQPSVLKYLDGTTIVPPSSPSGNTEVMFDEALEPDVDYDVRLFEEGTATPIATFSTVHITLVVPSLTLNGHAATDTVQVAEGEVLDVGVLNLPPSNTSRVFAAVIAPDGEGCAFSSRVWQITTTGLSPAVVTAHTLPGAYRVYACEFLGDGTRADLGAGSALLQVMAPVLTVNGKQASETAYARTANPLTAVVTWAPDLTDHVEIRTTGGVFYDNRPISGDQRTAQAVFATPPIAVPSSATPTYHATLLGPGGTVRVQGPNVVSLAYKVWLRTATIPEETGTDIPSNPNQPIPLNEILQAAVGVEGHVTGDWIGLFEIGANDASPEQTEEFGATTSETLLNAGVIPVYRAGFTLARAGVFEVRFFDGQTGARLGTSARITVAGGQGPGDTTRRLTVNDVGYGGRLKVGPGQVLTAVLEGGAFGPDDILRYVQTDNQQLIWAGEVFSQPQVSITVPQRRATYHLRWESGDGLHIVDGPDLAQGTGLPGVDTLTYYDTDAIGSVRLISDANGAEVSRHDYLPFGAESPVQSPLGEHKVKFVGKERDAESGLDYFGARYFSRETGVFSSADPITANPLRLVDPQRWNRYAYAVNSPLVNIDPSGRDAILVNFSQGAPISGSRFGHNGLVAVNASGELTFSDFGPRGEGGLDVPGRATTRALKTRLKFGERGLPTTESLNDLVRELEPMQSAPAGSVRLLYYRTSRASTAALEEWMKQQDAQTQAGDAPSYRLLGRNCQNYCRTGMGVADGVGGWLGLGLGMPNFEYWLLRGFSDLAFGTPVPKVDTEINQYKIGP